MIRSAIALLFVVTAVVAEEDKPIGPAVIDVKTDKADKIEVKTGDWHKPTKVTTAEELKKLVPDEAARDRIAKQVDLKTHDLLVFAWQGSGQDKLTYMVLESYPEQVPFNLAPGRTEDLRTHLKLFAVRKNVRWSAK